MEYINRVTQGHWMRTRVGAEGGRSPGEGGRGTVNPYHTSAQECFKLLRLTSICCGAFGLGFAVVSSADARTGTVRAIMRLAAAFRQESLHSGLLAKRPCMVKDLVRKAKSSLHNQQGLGKIAEF